jgi:hypothetical protein
MDQPVSVDAMAPVTGAVQWSVDHAAKTITVTVNIAFYPALPVSRPATDAEIKQIVSAIEGQWNGSHYKCYEFVVKVNAMAVAGPGAARDDYVDIALLEFVPGMRALTWTFGENPNSVLSGDPADKGVPVRGDSDGPQSVWPYPVPYSPDLRAYNPYAHEFGHLIGAPDGYVETKDAKGKPKTVKVPCHTIDIMVDDETGDVSSEVVTQVVQRSGNPEVAKIGPCPMLFDTNTTSLWLFFAEFKDFQIHARCEDYDPPTDGTANLANPMTFTGTASFQAGYLMGDDNADARRFLEALGLPAQPLATDQRVVTPVTFTLAPPSCAEKDKGIWSGTLTIAFSAITITGAYRWSTAQGCPVMLGPLLVNGLPTVSWFPGPALAGKFSIPAK